jgi:hypothetical protein
MVMGLKVNVVYNFRAPPLRASHPTQLVTLPSIFALREKEYKFKLLIT